MNQLKLIPASEKRKNHNAEAVQMQNYLRDENALREKINTWVARNKTHELLIDNKLSHRQIFLDKIFEELKEEGYIIKNETESSFIISDE